MIMVRRTALQTPDLGLRNDVSCGGSLPVHYVKLQNKLQEFEVQVLSEQ